MTKIEKVFEQEKEEAVKEAVKDVQKQIAKNIINDYTPEEVAEKTGLSMDDVICIIQEQNSNS